MTGPDPPDPTSQPPPASPFGRSLEDFGPLLPAEADLLGKCRSGDWAEIDAVLPVAPKDTNQVRAGFVRFLVLGGDADAPVHECGVRLRGAWIRDKLDLTSAVAERSLLLEKCRISQIIATDADLKALSLDGSRLEGGFVGGRLRCTGSLLFHNGFHASGGLDLTGATIAGDLTCEEGTFDVAIGNALCCQCAKISGNVLLRWGFRATGTVDVMRAKIEGDFDCSGAHFKAIDGEGYALLCDGTSVEGVFFFRNAKLGERHGGGEKRALAVGKVSLAGMDVRYLEDDARSWPATGVTLDGLTYGRFTDAPTEAATRIAWLGRQPAEHLGTEFRPQPWEQLIAVLRTMGHPNEARKIAIAKQDRLRRAGKIPWGTRTLHRLYGLLVGYGYRPTRLLITTGSVWLLCATAYLAAANPAWFGAETHLLAPPPAEAGKPPRAPDYRNFVPLVYSLDVLLPVVDLGYKKEWQPVVADEAGNRLIWGQALRFLYWFEIAFGWVAGLLLVGVLGNLIKKD